MLRRRHVLALTLTAVVPLAALPGATGAQERQKMSVLGLGSVRAAPDAASISFSVRRVGARQQNVRDFVNRRTLRLFASLRRVGVDFTGVQSSSVRLTRIRERRRGGRRHRVRYAGANDVTVFTQGLDLVGRIFDAGTAARVSDFSGPVWLLEDATPARAAATREATRDARMRAEAAAAETGMRIAGVESIDVEGHSGPYPAAGAPASGTTATPITPGLTRVDARVRVVFVLERAT